MKPVSDVVSEGKTQCRGGQKEQELKDVIFLKPADCQKYKYIEE
jgi:hypothetical protein